MHKSAEIAQPSPGTRVFRVRRKYLVVGVIGTLFCVAMGVESTVAAFWNLDGSFPRPKLAAFMLGSFWSCFTLLGVWIIAAYFRERLNLTDTGIVQQGIFRSKNLEFSEILQVQWRTRPVGGSVVLRTHWTKIRIELENFARDEREELIRFLRDRLPLEIQNNWSSFEVVPHCSPTPGKPVSRGAMIAISAIFLSFAVAFVYCWSAGLGTQFLFISVVNVVASIWSLWRTRWTKDLTASEHMETRG